MPRYTHKSLVDMAGSAQTLTKVNAEIPGDRKKVRKNKMKGGKRINFHS